MNNQNTNLNLFLALVLVAGLQFTLPGCGGGSDSGNVSDNTTIQDTSAKNTTQTDTVGPTIALPEYEPVTKSEILTTETNKIVNYDPDKSLLSLPATQSSELFVEPAFDFDSYKVINIDISATARDKTPITGALLAVSSIDKSIEEFDDPLIQEKSLLTKVFTDKNGQVIMALEVPDSVEALLLEISTIGIENKVIYNIDDSGNILHHFK